jgi:hypothetical protein
MVIIDVLDENITTEFPLRLSKKYINSRKESSFSLVEMHITSTFLYRQQHSEHSGLCSVV